MSFAGSYAYGSGYQQRLDSSCVRLTIRQQPSQALVTLEGKEKSRKPIDPPPIIQIEVRHESDPQKHFLVSPYFFMYAQLLPDNPEIEQQEQVQAQSKLMGQLCSSLHRLKDVNNSDGGFFIFGDLSVKRQGRYRLRFTLYDVSKLDQDAAFISDVISDPFAVVAAKDFHGMEESSYLSRAFSDQGVRLRLRKEPRSIASHHRRGPQKYSPGNMHASFSQPSVQFPPAQRPDQYGDSVRGVKRQRSEGDFSDNPSLFPPAQIQRTAYPAFGGGMVLPQGYETPKQEMPERAGSFSDQGSLNYTTRGNPYQQPSSSGSNWQGASQQPAHATLPANAHLGNISEQSLHGMPSGPSSAAAPPRPRSSYYSNTGSSAGYGSYGYQTQPGQQYSSLSQRTSSESFPSMIGGLQTPTSLTEQCNIQQGHDTTYIPSSSGTMSAATATASHTPVQSHYTHDFSGISSNYAHGHGSSYDDSSPYQPAPLPQHAQQSMYPSAMSSGPASSAMLLGEALPQTFYHNEESSPPYPTPTQQKPSHQWQ